MATRRIARGRGMSPVPIIVLSVIIVGLLGSTITLGLKVGDLDLEIKNWEKKLQDEQKKGQDAQAEFRKYERLVGLNFEGARREFEVLKADLAKKASLPSLQEPEGALKPFDDMKTLLGGYADRCAALEKTVTRLEGELAGAKDQRETAVRDGEQTAKAKDEQIVAERKVSTDLRTRLATAEGERDKIRTDLTAQIEADKAEKTKQVKQIAALEKDVKVLNDKLKKDVEIIADLKNPKLERKPLVEGIGGEPADGKILTVDADGKNLMVDMGRRDWVEVGMIFTVYEKSEEGRREKGQIQIRQVYDEIARAKVLKQDELDPILPGMVVVNPAFKRGKKIEFVLVGRFSEPGIEQLLSRYPCKISKTVSYTTDYVVIGEGIRQEGEPAPEDSEEVLTAKEMKKTIMKESELLHYLGERG